MALDEALKFIRDNWRKDDFQGSILFVINQERKYMKWTSENGTQNFIAGRGNDKVTFEDKSVKVKRKSSKNRNMKSENKNKVRK